MLELKLRWTSSFRTFLVSNREKTFGSSNRFSSRPQAFDGRARALGQVSAAHAAAALNSSITEAGPEQAVRSRDLIGLAKDVLLKRHHVGADEDHQMLRNTSNDRKITVCCFAEQVAGSGALPD